MRDLLAHADLARYAGQFVWLDLSYDEPRNRDFMSKYGASATPTFFVIDPQGAVVAMQTGVMSLVELKQFLDRGASAVLVKGQTPADAALTRGDELLAEQPGEAAKAYLQALQLGAAEWSHRELAQASMVKALQASRQWQQCAETAATDAVTMKRDVLFVRTVVAGMWCLTKAGPADWVDTQKTLQLLAEETLSLSITVRDHRDSIYRTLMLIAVAHKDNSAALKWGDRWLAELDQIRPRSNDERSAIDIARVENLQIIGDPARILPALRASEKAMPDNYISSLRLAEMELAAKQYEEAIATCHRGLARRPGAFGKTWLLEIEAEALEKKGRTTEARQRLQQALKVADRIPSVVSRDRAVAAIKKACGPSRLQPK